jgi:hypothetical protein
MSRTIRRACAVLVAATAVWAAGAQSAAAQSNPAAGPGGPVLVLTDTSFGRFYPEILRAEGLNEFAVAPMGSLSPALLNAYQVVIVANTPVSSAQANMLSAWVSNGGNLIAMRPDATLASLLGLGADGGDLENAYMAVDTSAGPGVGITAGTMQFHGGADLWTRAATTRQVATLFSSSSTSTGAPAVTLRSVGTRGGQAAAFTYDLARSVVYTRQGNPAQAGQDFEGAGPIRSNDLFQPDWLDIAKVAIPQADEQQRLLANLITQMNLDRAPLPRFWYLPRGEQAAVVMTGDDHGTGGTIRRFNDFVRDSPAGCSVANWGCIRGTSYVYTNTSQLTNTVADGYESQGFEIALHLDTGCSNRTPADLSNIWAEQLSAFAGSYPDLNSPRTNRTHCVPWGDWVGAATAERGHSVRLDTNYYYFPGPWAAGNPGLFTGSGFPMRFADEDGTLVDVYQAATQITDEWGNDATIALHIKALIDRALGSQGYHGVFTVNMHTDKADEDRTGALDIVKEAKARGVPVVSAVQMLDWLDGRNTAAFRNLSYSAGQLRFTVTRDARANGLQGMVPARSASGALTSLTRNGVAISAPIRRLKGIDYAVFDATQANYVATYAGGVPETRITQAAVSGNVARFVFTGSGAAAFQCRLDGAAFAACGTPKSYGGLKRGGHTFQVRAVSASGVADPTPAQHLFTIGKTTSASGKSKRGKKVKLAPRDVRVSSRGRLRLRVHCPLAEDRCRVQLKLKLGGKTVASRKLKVSGSTTRSIWLTLRRSARERLFEKGALRVKATAVSRDSGGGRAVTRKTIRLVAP